MFYGMTRIKAFALLGMLPEIGSGSPKFQDSLTSEDGAETSVDNYKHNQHNIPEEFRTWLHCGGGLKSLMTSYRRRTPSVFDVLGFSPSTKPNLVKYICRSSSTTYPIYSQLLSVHILGEGPCRGERNKM